jgi:hypothetical protein
MLTGYCEYIRDMTWRGCWQISADGSFRGEQCDRWSPGSVHWGIYRDVGSWGTIVSLRDWRPCYDFFLAELLLACTWLCRLVALTGEWHTCSALRPCLALRPCSAPHTCPTLRPSPALPQPCSALPALLCVHALLLHQLSCHVCAHATQLSSNHAYLTYTYHVGATHNFPQWLVHRGFFSGGGVVWHG